jgi:hypothetical protein
MRAIKVLIVEDSGPWHLIHQIHLKQALPDSEPPIIENDFVKGNDALRGGHWSLLIADIGLPPDSKHVLGMQLVGTAREVKVPCIVVSGTRQVTRELVRDLTDPEGDYRVRGFFTKKELERSTEKQRKFQDLVRKIVGSDNSAHPLPLPPTQSAGAVAQPPPPPPPSSLRVTIGFIDTCYYIESGNLPQLLIEDPLREKIFLFIVRNLHMKVPTKVIPNTVLNKLVCEPEAETASQPLRTAINHLNDWLFDWAKVPKKQRSTDRRWILGGGKREHGYRLNTIDVQWDLSEDVEDFLQRGKSPWDLVTDRITRENKSVRAGPAGSSIEQTPADKDQRLPAQPKRKQPPYQD